MKKLFILILAAACTFMFASGSFAEDRLSLTGEFRIMAWSQDGYSARDTMTFNDNDEIDYIQQRFRTQATIKVADDVKMVTRFDIGEGTWGVDYVGAITRPANGNATGRLANKIDFDRAYVQIDKEMWSLTAGQQYVGLGILQVLDSQIVGLKGVFKFDPVKVSLVYGKINENGSISDELTANDDLDLYAVNVGMSMSNVALDLFAVTLDDNTAADNSPLAVGLHAKTSMGAVNLRGEVASWFGDNGANQDYSGFQLYLGADTNLSDALKLGGELFFAQGADAGDIQMTTFADFGDFDPFSINTDVLGFISPGFLTGSIFDFTGDMAGVQGLDVFADFAVMEGMNVGGKVGYFQPEDDDNTNVDSAIVFNAYVSYMIATNTKLSLTYFHTAPDLDVGSVDDATAFVLCFKLNF